MAVDDLWVSSRKKGEDGKPLKLGKYGRGKRYRVRTPGHPDVLFANGDKEAAKALSVSREADRVAGLLPRDPRKGLVTFEAYAEMVLAGELERGELKERTYKKYLSLLRRHAFPYLGDKTMNDCDPLAMKGWIAWLRTRISRKTKEPLSVTTVNSLWVIVGHVFKVAQIDKTRPEHPLAGLTRVATPKPPRVHPWPETTVGAVLSAMDLRDRGPAAMSVMVGARPGESLAFSLGDFRPKARRLTIRHQVVYGGTGGVRLALPKRDKERVVPLPAVAWDMVSEHVERHGTIRVWCECHKQYNEVVWSDRGELWSPRRYTARVWTPAITAAGLLDTTPNVPTGEDGRPALRLVTEESDEDESLDLRPGQHQLRHFYASAEIADGANPVEIQKRLGHAHLSTTLGTYHHQFQDQEDAAADRVSARVAGLPIMGARTAPTGTTGKGE